MTLIRLRGGNEVEWADADPILARREPGVVPGGGVKIGDGSTPWSGLPWASGIAQDSTADGGDAAATGTPQDGGDASNTWDAQDGGTAIQAAGTVEDGGDSANTGLPVVNGGLAAAAPVVTGSETGGNAGTVFSGTGTVTRALRDASAATTLDEFDHIVHASGTFTVTLPNIASVALGREFEVKNTGTGLITVAGDVNIDGASSQALAQWESLTVVAGTSIWTIR